MHTLRDAYSVWWADLRILMHLWRQFLGTSLMSPILYLLAFGYGMGRGVTVGVHSYLDFLIPGIIALTAMNTSFNGTGMKLNVDRLFFHSFDEILMSPVSSVALVLGKSMIGVVRGFVVSVLFMVIGLFVSSAQVTVMFVVTLVLSCIMFSFMGFLCAMYVKSHQGMATFSSIILLPMSFLGGTFFALEQVPRWLEVVLHVFPLTWVTSCLRAEALGDGFPWVSFVVVVAMALALFAACMDAVKRSSI
ncbi:MAG: ABC transporter permease [Thermoleophilia bacterium]|nr:ABC transporter permease [Thermoleophilia bacterium]